MNTSFAAKILGCLSLFFSVATLSLAASKSTLVALGDDTYSVVRQAGTGLTRNTAVLKAEALDDAAKYCASKGKQLKVISATEEKPIFMTADYARAKVIFKTVDANDPELKNDPAPPAPTASGSTSFSAPNLSDKNAGPGDFYVELLKLDDLRKRGILTEEEFQAEKKKILKHTK